MATQVWDTLIYRDPKTNEYKGQLATAWKWIDDKTLELELRQGVKFHNGEEFDADDVVFTLNFVSEPDSKVIDPAERQLDRPRREARQVQGAHRHQAAVPGGDRVSGRPDRRFTRNEYYAKVGPKGMNEKPVGSGPIQGRRARDRQVRALERNADYFKDRPQKPQATIEKVEIRFIPDRQTQVAEMLSGGHRPDHERAARPGRAAQGVPHLQRHVRRRPCASSSCR